MRDRITRDNLEYLVKKINTLTNSPQEPYSVNEDGKLKANIGNYHIDGAYGGVKMNRMSNPSGGVSAVSIGGFIPKRGLYNQLLAFISGIEAAPKKVIPCLE